jgi:Na+-transporting methylmalonyl-CoA/oxaloacetate decarboxylase beta subunit
MKVNSKALSAIVLASMAVAAYSYLLVPLLGMLETAREGL